jgi:hypothetical protein
MAVSRIMSSVRHKRLLQRVLCGGLLLGIVYRLIFLTGYEADKNEVRGESQKQTEDTRVRLPAVVKAHEASITHLTLDDVPGISQDLIDYASNLSDASSTKDKGFLLDVLKEAGVEKIDDSVIKLLPTWTQVSQLYGSQKPVIIGLERCRAYRKSVRLNDRLLRIAGVINTGTTAMAGYMASNQGGSPGNDKERPYNVPWGKHQLYSMRYNQTEEYIAKRKVDTSTFPQILPIVMVRDPYTWLYTSCRVGYMVKHYPRLTANECMKIVSRDAGIDPLYPAPIYIPPQNNMSFPSLLNWYTAFYNEYLQSPSPRLLVRYEDFLWDPRGVIEQIRACAGFDPLDEFTYMLDNSKAYQGKKQVSHNVVSAWVLTGHAWNRQAGMEAADVQWVARMLESEAKELMDGLHYRLQ